MQFACACREEFKFGVVLLENDNIAFVVLGGRPVNLPVILKALLLHDDDLIVAPTADNKALLSNDQQNKTEQNGTEDQCKDHSRGVVGKSCGPARGTLSS